MSRTIVGQSMGVMEMSNLSGSGGGGVDPVEGKYVLKSGDTMTGDLTMQSASVDVLGGEIKVNGGMSRVLVQGGAGIRVEEGGSIVVADAGNLDVNGSLQVGGKGTVGADLSAAGGVFADGVGVQVGPIPKDPVLDPGAPGGGMASASMAGGSLSRRT